MPPFVLDPNLDDDQNDQAGASPGGTQIVSGQTGVVGSGAGAAAVPTSTATPKGTRSGSWTNLTSYLDANQGNDAAMGAKVKTAADTAGSAATTASGTFKTNADTDIAKGSTKDTGMIGQLGSDPSKVDKAAYDKQRTAVYTGPKAAVDIGGWQDADKAYRGVNQIADMASGKDADLTKAGVSGHDQRTSVLGRADVFGRPSYSQGERNLDSFILGGGQQGQQSLQQIQNQYGSGSQFQGGWADLQKQIGGVGQAGSQIDLAKEATAKTAADTTAAYGNAVGGMAKKLDALGLQAGQKTAAQQASLAAFSNGDREAIKAAGLEPWGNTIKNLAGFGFTPGMLVGDSGQAYNLGDVAAQGDVDSYKALGALEEGTLPAADFTEAGGRDWTLDPAKVEAMKKTAGLMGESGKERDPAWQQLMFILGLGPAPAASASVGVAGTPGAPSNNNTQAVASGGVGSGLGRRK